MEIKTLNNLYSDENTYFIIQNGEAIIIDPGSDADKIMEFEKDIKIKYIFITHCHYDHISGVNELVKKTGAKLVCGKACSENIKNTNINLTEFGLGRKEIIDNTDIILSEDEDFYFNGIKIKLIETPGHTSCSVCYLMEKNLFSGDTLFYQNVGRWDLPTGNGDMLQKSIKDKIYSLGDEITVYPGHGRKTSVGYEKKYNFYVKE